MEQYAVGTAVDIRAVVSGEPEGVNFYYRQPGLDTFQVIPLTRGEAGDYALSFNTSLLTTPGFDYYLEAWTGKTKVRSPAEAPEKCHAASGQGEAPPAVPSDIPTPQAEEAAFRMPIHASANGLKMISHKQAAAGAVESNASGNLQVSLDIRPASRWGGRVDATAAYASQQALPGAQPFSLANLMMTLTGGSHSLKAGDLNFNESEYTVFGLGRRGFDYTYDNQKLYVRAFTASTQQVTGFAGLGFPKAQTRLYGGAAGYKFLGEALSLKAVYVGGKDDPSLGLGVGAASTYTARQGDAAALIEETHLFSQSLNLRAEFASSWYDGDLSDTNGRVSDSAFQVGGDMRVGAFNAGARYKRIGRDFNSVGLSYLTGDRKGWESNVGFTKGAVSIQGSYSREQDNVKDDPAQPMTRNLNGQLACTINFSSKFSMNGSYRRSDQATFQGGLLIPQQDGQTTEISGGAAWMPSANASVNCTVVDSETTSINSPDVNAQALTINAGGNFRAGEVLIFSPSVSWSRTSFATLGTTASASNGNLTLELWMIKQVLSLAFYGTGGLNETPGAGTSKTLDLTAALGFQLGNIIKFMTVTLSLRGNHNRQDIAGNVVTDTRLFAQGDLAF